jgi:hypothetical protein
VVYPRSWASVHAGGEGFLEAQAGEVSYERCLFPEAMDEMLLELEVHAGIEAQEASAVATLGFGGKDLFPNPLRICCRDATRCSS